MIKYQSTEQEAVSKKKGDKREENVGVGERATLFQP